MNAPLHSCFCPSFQPDLKSCPHKSYSKMASSSYKSLGLFKRKAHLNGIYLFVYIEVVKHYSPLPNKRVYTFIFSVSFFHHTCSHQGLHVYQVSTFRNPKMIVMNGYQLFILMSVLKLLLRLINFAIFHSNQIICLPSPYFCVIEISTLHVYLPIHIYSNSIKFPPYTFICPYMFIREGRVVKSRQD